MTTVRAVATPTGTIGIPQEIMDRYGVRGDERLVLDELPEGIVVRRPRKSFEDLFEILRHSKLSDDAWECIHEGREDDPNRL